MRTRLVSPEVEGFFSLSDLSGSMKDVLSLSSGVVVGTDAVLSSSAPSGAVVGTEDVFSVSVSSGSVVGSGDVFSVSVSSGSVVGSGDVLSVSVSSGSVVGSGDVLSTSELSGTDVVVSSSGCRVGGVSITSPTLITSSPLETTFTGVTMLFSITRCTASFAIYLISISLLFSRSSNDTVSLPPATLLVISLPFSVTV